MKKVLSLVLAVALVLGMSAIGFATSTIPKFDATLLGWSTSADAELTNTSTVNPEKTYKVYLDYGGKIVTRDMVREYKLGVQVRAVEGSGIVDTYKIKYDSSATGANAGAAFVELSLVDEWVSTKEIDFSIELYLTANKSRVNDTKIATSGVFANSSVSVGENEEFIYIADTPVVEADDYIRNIEVELGQGVSIFTKMFEGKKYYGRVTQEPKAEDEAILAQYPAIDTVYYLKTIGLASTGENVKFDLENNYYAYAQDENGNLVYVGRTNDRLAYYTKYFLSSKELDVAGEEPGTEEPGIIEPGDNTEQPPVIGGDGEGSPANVNNNPSTGR